MDADTQTFPTMLGAPSGDPPPDDSRLPAEKHGAWRIELRYLPIDVPSALPLVRRGHAFLSLVDPEGNTAGQLHGVPKSKHTGKIMDIGSDGDGLVARDDRWMSPEGTRKIGDVAAGPYDEIVRGKWSRGLQAFDEINRRNLDYKADDGSYEFFGGSGGQIQNSNSVAHTFGKAMDLPLDAAIRDAGLERKFPGWGRDLLDPSYKPYVAPPTFPPDDIHRQ
jgi:hypothetical protein